MMFSAQYNIINRSGTANTSLSFSDGGRHHKSVTSFVENIVFRTSYQSNLMSEHDGPCFNIIASCLSREHDVHEQLIRRVRSVACYSGLKINTMLHG